GRAYATFCVLARDPAALGDAELLVVRPAKLDLVVGPRARRPGMAGVRSVCHRLGARRLQLAGGPRDVVPYQSAAVGPLLPGRLPALSQGILRWTAGLTAPRSSAIHFCESGQMPSGCG